MFVDTQTHFVRALLRAYSGMLSAEYVSATESEPYVAIVVRPPKSENFVMDRIFMSTKIIFFEAVRRTLLRACYTPELWKTVKVIIELLKHAEMAPYVTCPLMSPQTEHLLSLDWDGLLAAEPPHMQEISEVKWLASEVYGLVEPYQCERKVSLEALHAELLREHFPEAAAPEAPEAPAPAAPDPGAPAPEAASPVAAEDGPGSPS